MKKAVLRILLYGTVLLVGVVAWVTSWVIYSGRSWQAAVPLLAQFTSPAKRNPAEEAEREVFRQAYDLIQRDGGTGETKRQAEALLRGLAERNSQSAYALLGLAELMYYAEGGLGGRETPIETTALLNRVNALRPDLPESFVLEAKIRLREGRLAEASSAAQLANTMLPDRPEAKFVVAAVLDKQGRYEEAEAWYRKTIASMTDDDRRSNVYAWLGDMLVSPARPRADVVRDLDKAREAYLMAAKLAPGSPWKANDYANFLIRHDGDFDGASRELIRALNIMDFRAARFNLGIATYGRWAKAYEDSVTDKNTLPDVATLARQTGLEVDRMFAYAAGVRTLHVVGRALVKTKAVSNFDAPDWDGWPAIVNAAFVDDAEYAAMLVEGGANVNAENPSGETALSIFLQKGNLSGARLVLDRGARVNHVTKKGWSMLMLALQADDEKLVLTRLMLKRGADPTLPFFQERKTAEAAILWSRPEAARLFLEMGVLDANGMLTSGQTYLLYSCLVANKAMVALLLEKGANPWVRNGSDDVLVLLERLKKMPQRPEAGAVSDMIIVARASHAKPVNF